MKTEKTQVFVMIAENFWRIFWRDNWRSIISAVENFRYFLLKRGRNKCPRNFRILEALFASQGGSELKKNTLQILSMNTFISKIWWTAYNNAVWCMYNFRKYFTKLKSIIYSKVSIIRTVGIYFDICLVKKRKCRRDYFVYQIGEKICFGG